MRVEGAGFTWGGPCWRGHLSSSRFPGGALNVLFCGEKVDWTTLSLTHHLKASRTMCFLRGQAQLTLCFLHFMEKFSSMRTQSVGGRNRRGVENATLTHRQGAVAHWWWERKWWLPDCAWWSKRAIYRDPATRTQNHWEPWEHPGCCCCCCFKGYILNQAWANYAPGAISGR